MGHEERLSEAACALGDAQVELDEAVERLRIFDAWADGAISMSPAKGLTVSLTPALEQSIRAVLVQEETYARRKRNEAATAVKELV